jgi:MerR family redox-sensitive transcriptional activator SoxR
MDEMTIGEVAQLAGLQTSTLRYYERIGLLPSPKRVNGQRRYAPEVLQILAVIQLAKEVNFSLEEIHTLLYDSSAHTSPSERWRALAQRKQQEVEAIIAQAQEMKRLLDEAIACEYLLLELDESVLTTLSPKHHPE